MEIQSVSYEEACFRLVSLSEVSNIVCLLVIQCNNVSSYFEMFIKLKYIHAFDNSWRKKVEHFKFVWLKIHLSDVISMSWSAVCECERKKKLFVTVESYIHAQLFNFMILHQFNCKEQPFKKIWLVLCGCEEYQKWQQPLLDAIWCQQRKNR